MFGLNRFSIHIERQFYSVYQFFRRIVGKPLKPKPLPPGDTAFHKVEHFIVLMLENRSFDHMLGFSGLPGIEGLVGREAEAINLVSPADLNSKMVQVTADAAPILNPDPPHEFDDVRLQLLGDPNGVYAKDFSNVNNSGFIASYSRCKGLPSDPGAIMKCHSVRTVPILFELAKQFAVCDHWFASLPGPTWPNRFFIHGATSGGLDDSPSNNQTVKSYAGTPFEFENGTIYDAISNGGYRWRIYHGDFLPQVLAFKGMEDHFFDSEKYRNFDGFAEDLKSEDKLPEYIFIEPNYGNSLDSDTTEDFRGGNSQHPVGDIGDGEKLIKEIYDSLRQSKFWKSSCLVITYDEHGGFYDHIRPMPATPPGDQSRYNTRGFDFAHYGVRVPALIISPLIEPGTVDSKVHDHVSVLKTVEKRLGLPPLSLRDKVGSTSEAFDDLFTRFEPRADSPDLPAPYFDPPHRSEAMSLLSQNIALDVNTRNFVHLAGRIEKSMIDEKAQDYIAQVAAIDVRLAVLDKSDQKEAKKYIQEIQKKAKIRKEGGAK